MPATSTNLYFIVRHIRLVNKTAAGVTFSLYIGATGANAAGTEFMGLGTTIAANLYVDWYGALPLEVADFMVGGAGTATALTFEAEGEMGIR
jgi:hypothetical protein